MTDDSKAERIGIYGGSFDPVHKGHMIVAESAMVQERLDRVIFIPAANSPLKDHAPKADGSHRLEMLQLAADVEPKFEVYDWELREGGVNYTVDTVQHLRDLYPDSKLYLIIGADQLELLPNWRDIDRLGEMIGFLCYRRSGYVANIPEALSGLDIEFVDSPVYDVSSTELRNKIKAGSSESDDLPPKVLEYIRANSLYI